MSRKDVAADFAAQKKAKGKASALYFEGPIAYSYGPHFPIAIIRGTRAFVNSDGYSPTTARHKSLIRCALDRAGYTLTERDTAQMKELAATV
jgi:hypothetical protein